MITVEFSKNGFTLYHAQYSNELSAMNQMIRWKEQEFKDNVARDAKIVKAA